LTSNHFFIQKSLAGGPWLCLEGREHHHRSKVARLRSARDSEMPPSDILILVGPEGGWTEAEEDKALRRGYEPVSLGTNILRAETASLAAMAIISHFWDS